MVGPRHTDHDTKIVLLRQVQEPLVRHGVRVYRVHASATHRLEVFGDARGRRKVVAVLVRRERAVAHAPDPEPLGTQLKEFPGDRRSQMWVHVVIEYGIAGGEPTAMGIAGGEPTAGSGSRPLSEHFVGRYGDLPGARITRTAPTSVAFREKELCSHGTFRRCWFLIRYSCNFVDHPESSSDTSVNFCTGLPGARHHQYGCSSQPLQICGSAGQTSPGSEDLFLRSSLVATACCRHGQRASHVMGNVRHT